MGVTAAEELPPETNLVEPLRAVGRSVVDYALQLLAWASAEPKTLAAVRKALKPIDDQRAAAARRAGSGGSAEPAEEEAPAGAATPETPVPDVPT